MHPNPEVLALLAVGDDSAAGPVERTHVASCPECTQQVRDLTRLADIGRAAGGEDRLQAPHPRVWDRVQAEIQGIGGATDGAGVTVLRPAPDPTSAEPAREPDSDAGGAGRSSRGRRLLSLALAAAVALVLGFGIGLGIDRLRQQDGTVVTRTDLTALPDWTGSSGMATLERNRDGVLVMTVQMSTDRPMDGNQQAWLIDPDSGAMVTLGLLSDLQGLWTVPTTIDLQRFKVLDISEEPVNDPDTAHSRNSIVRGTLTV